MSHGLIFLMGASVIMTTNLQGGPPRGAPWKAASVLARSELIVAVERRPRETGFFTVSSPELFSGQKGAAKIRTFRVSDVLAGEVDAGATIVVLQPPGDMHHYASFLPGDMLLFLKRMPNNEVEMLRNKVSRPRDELASTVWTLAEGKYQWMSAIQLSAFRNGDQVDFLDRERLMPQLEQHGGVERTKAAVIDYIRSLVELRSSVIAGQHLSADDELDTLQRDVIHTARDEAGR